MFRISELTLATLIQRYDKKKQKKKKKHFISRTRDLLKCYMLSGATFYDYINTIYQFIKSILDNKMTVFEEYEPFKSIEHSQKRVIFPGPHLLVSVKKASSPAVHVMPTLICT